MGASPGRTDGAWTGAELDPASVRAGERSVRDHATATAAAATITPRATKAADRRAGARSSAATPPPVEVELALSVGNDAPSEAAGAAPDVSPAPSNGASSATTS